MSGQYDVAFYQQSYLRVISVLIKHHSPVANRINQYKTAIAYYTGNIMTLTKAIYISRSVSLPDIVVWSTVDRRNRQLPLWIIKGILQKIY